MVQIIKFVMAAIGQQSKPVQIGKMTERCRSCRSYAAMLLDDATKLGVFYALRHHKL